MFSSIVTTNGRSGRFITLTTGAEWPFSLPSKHWPWMFPGYHTSGIMSNAQDMRYPPKLGTESKSITPFRCPSRTLIFSLVWRSYITICLSRLAVQMQSGLSNSTQAVTSDVCSQNGSPTFGSLFGAICHCCSLWSREHPSQTLWVGKNQSLF